MGCGGGWRCSGGVEMLRGGRDVPAERLYPWWWVLCQGLQGLGEGRRRGWGVVMLRVTGWWLLRGCLGLVGW